MDEEVEVEVEVGVASELTKSIAEATKSLCVADNEDDEESGL